MLISQIFYCKISDVKPYQFNSKLHPDTQIQQIANSITEFGFNDPIAVDEHMLILEGHGRFLAAKYLNLQTIPVIKVTGLTEPQKVAYRLAHNKINANSGFDLSLLQVDFGMLEAYDFDTTITGFSTLDVNISNTFGDTDQLKDSLEPEANLLLEENKEGFKRKCPECGHEWTESRKPKKKH
jgi:ParB-like chromosome segregation protein Spo0J